MSYWTFAMGHACLSIGRDVGRTRPASRARRFTSVLRPAVGGSCDRAAAYLRPDRDERHQPIFMGGRLRDKTTRAGRLAWFPLTAHQPTDQWRGIAYVMRHSAVAKGIKTAVPERIASGLIVIALYFVALVFLNHVFLSYEQGAGQLRPIARDNDASRHAPVGRGPDRTSSPFSFRPSERCHATGLRVEKNVPYRIELAVIEPFEEGGEPIELPFVGKVDWRSLVFWPFRRWWTAGWWQPVARIEPDGTEEWPLLPVKGGATSVEGLKAGESYAAEFTATRDGEVFVFVNDAFGAIPFWGYS